MSYTFLFWLPLYITSVGECVRPGPPSHYHPCPPDPSLCPPTDHLDARSAGELSTLFDVGGIFGEFLLRLAAPSHPHTPAA